MFRRARVRTCLAASCVVFVARAAAQSADGTALVRGVVYDSLITAAPLRGAEVWIEGTNRSTHTDARGRFELSGLAAGRYTLTFYHPVLDSTGLAAPPVVVDVAASGTAVVTLATPSPAVAHRTLCPQDPWRETGVVLGLVRDAAAGRALAGVAVTAQWTVYTIGQGPVRRVERTATARSDAAGRVLLCGVPTDVALVLRGQAGEGAAGMVLVDLAERAFGRADLHLAGAPGSGTVTGVVRNRNGTLLAGPVVIVAGTENRTSADHAGAFTLQDVMAGSRIVEARAIGYRSMLTQLTIRPGLTQRVEIVMEDSIPILDPVVVEADYRPYLARIGFSQRRNSAQGHFLDTADVWRARARQFEEVFRMVPGVRLRPNGSNYLVELQRGEGQILNPALANYCPPSYFIDGVYFPLPPIQTPSVPVVPEEILAIEIYSNIFSAPPQYQRRDGACGVILVWTKRGAPQARQR
jgi:Carboxypeptidase regulatory-like domain/CarboxypepD_reg-like domain